MNQWINESMNQLTEYIWNGSSTVKNYSIIINKEKNLMLILFANNLILNPFQIFPVWEIWGWDLDSHSIGDLLEGLQAVDHWFSFQEMKGESGWNLLLIFICIIFDFDSFPLIICIMNLNQNQNFLSRKPIFISVPFTKIQHVRGSGADHRTVTSCTQSPDKKQELSCTLELQWHQGATLF